MDVKRLIVVVKRSVYLTLMALAIAFLFGGIAVAQEQDHTGFEPIREWFCDLTGIDPDKPVSQTLRGRLNLMPTVSIVSPSDGSTLNNRNVEIVFDVTNFNAGPIGSPHVHFHLDNDPLPFMFFNGNDPSQFGQQAALFDFDFTSRATWVSTDTIRFNALSNGDHTITVNLVDDQHNVYGNPEATVTFDFTVDVTPDDILPPNALAFVKEEPSPGGMGATFDNDPTIVSDLYLLTPPTPAGTLTQLTDVAVNGGGVSDPEVSFDGTRILFSMKPTPDDTWHVWEINVDGTGLRQVTFDPPYRTVNDIDPIYLPDGKILFASDRLKQRDEYNVTTSTQLYTANADGTDVILIEPNPSHDHNPTIIRDGRITFDRWDHLGPRNRFTQWHMNQDGSSGFVFFGGASPRDDEVLGETQGIEGRQLEDGQMVGIFASNNTLPGVMAIYDNRNGDLEDLPKPIEIGPTGLYRTPYPFTTQELVYSYSSSTNPVTAGFGLYTLPWSAEIELLDDETVSTAPGPGTDNSYRTYNINMSSAGRIYVEVTGSADSNGASEDDDLWIWINGVEYDDVLERRLDGDLIEGLTDTFRVDADVPAGNITIQIATDETPTVHRVRIVQAAQPSTPTLLYDDPTTNEVSPIPVRITTTPPIYPSRVNPDLSWGTFIVRDISLRGDFRQPNHDDVEGDPNLNFHLDIDKLVGLRVFQNVTRHHFNQDRLAGSANRDPMRVLGIAPQNEYGTAIFQVPANNVTAWDVVGLDGEGIVHERVWSLVIPGEVRTCGGCHVPQMPYTQRAIGPIPAPTDLRTRGEVYEFTKHVLPILQESCQGCHTGATPEGDLNLYGDRATFDALFELDVNRLPMRYIENGASRDSFVFQLLTGDSRGHPPTQLRIDTINIQADHTTMVSAEQLADLNTWIDTSNAFAYMREGEVFGEPYVTSALPHDGALINNRNTGISIRFSAPIDRVTLNETTFVVENAVTRAPVAGTLTWGDNRHVTFRPDTPFPAGTYTVTINDIFDIKDQATPEQMTTPFTSSFTVSGPPDSTPPQIVELPAASGHGRGAPIVVRFDEPIDPSTIDELSLWVESENGTFVEGEWGVTLNGLEASFAPIFPLADAEPYTLYLTTDILDLAGNALAAPVTHQFIVNPIAEPSHHAVRIDRATGGGPEKVAVSPDGSRVLVSNQAGTGSVSVFDGTTWALLTEWTTVGSTPFGLAFSPNGNQAYVTSTDDGQFRIIRVSDGAVLATITSGMTTPRSVTPNNAGDRVYIADNGGTAAIHEVDVEVGSPTFGQIVRSLTLPNSILDTAIDADDRLLYYSKVQSQMGVVDLGLWREVDNIALDFGEANDIVLSADNRQLLLTSYEFDLMQVVDVITREPIFIISLDEYPESIAYSPDEKFIYVAERSAGTVAVIDAATLTVVERLNLPNGGLVEGIAVSPDGQWVYAVGDDGTGTLRVFGVSDFSDTTAPTVSNIEPSNGTAVNILAELFVEFDETLDRESIDSQTISITDDNRSAVVPGELQISDDNHTIEFIPDQLWQPGTNYTINLSTGLRDLQGNTLTAPVSSVFAVPATLAPVSLTHDLDISAFDPYGIAKSPDESVLVIANAQADILSWLDPVTLTPIDTPLAVGNRPYGVTFSSDGSRLLVTNEVDNSLMIINVATRQILDTITGFSDAEYVTISPDDNFAYVTGYNATGVAKVNLGTGQLLGEVQAMTRPGRARFGPDGLLYVPTFNELWRMNPDDSWSRLSMAGGYAVDVAFEGSGRYAFVGQTWQDRLKVVDLLTWTKVMDIPVGDEPHEMQVSADNRVLLLVNRTDDTLELFDLVTFEIIQSTPFTGNNYDRLYWDEVNQRVLIASISDDNVQVFNIDYCSLCTPTATTLLGTALAHPIWLTLVAVGTLLLTTWTIVVFRGKRSS